MDIEFHFYWTYLIAARAGFDPKTAHLIAYSAQYVDDNTTQYEIYNENESGFMPDVLCYRNYISQTKNILKPGHELIRIYPLFHFIPGDPFAESAWRVDGAMHWLNTTPNSENSQRILQAAFDVGTPYRIGIASHAYVDTWAHQNFVGVFDDFNSMETMLGFVAPNIGHADAGFQPDEINLMWSDDRLVAHRISNRDRFEAAARHLFTKYIGHIHGREPLSPFNSVADGLIEDLRWATDSKHRSVRQARYHSLSMEKRYLHAPPDSRYDFSLSEEQLEGWTLQYKGYDEGEWFNRSVKKRPWYIPFGPRYRWRDSSYMTQDWYWFQEAVKGHQKAAWDILLQTNLRGLKFVNW